MNSIVDNFNLTRATLNFSNVGQVEGDFDFKSALSWRTKCLNKPLVCRTLHLWCYARLHLESHNLFWFSRNLSKISMDYGQMGCGVLKQGVIVLTLSLRIDED